MNGDPKALRERQHRRDLLPMSFCNVFIQAMSCILQYPDRTRTENVRSFSSIAEVNDTEPMVSDGHCDDSSHGNGKMPITPCIISLRRPLWFGHPPTKRMLIRMWVRRKVIAIENSCGQPVLWLADDWFFYVYIYGVFSLNMSIASKPGIWQYCSCRFLSAFVTLLFDREGRSVSGQPCRGKDPVNLRQSGL